MSEAYNDWVGRSEMARDIVTAGLVDRLEATLDSGVRRDGAALRPLGHWCLFLPQTPQSQIGTDGHAVRGGFLPPVHHLPRRMWAGSRLTFHGDMHIGMAVERRSIISLVTRKQGASGELIFVTVRHEISQAGGTLLVSEEHDIVYRGAMGAAVKLSGETAQAGMWRRELVPDAVLLFRYSALTFNGHRIHYDRPYVTEVEGYPGLIVHGPLIATLLLDLVHRHMPGAAITAYSFRALSPVFEGAILSLNGLPPDGEGLIKLWACTDDGRVAMRAEAHIARQDVIS